MAKVLRLADLDLATFEKIRRSADAWTLVRAGATIELADATTIRERTDRIVDAKQHRQDQAADAFHQTFRRLHGTGVA